MHLHANHILRDLNKKYDKTDHGIFKDSEDSPIYGNL